MANLLNPILVNKPTKPASQAVLPALTFSVDGKVKPLDYKGTLLPSKIFGSPKEYMHDLKQDVLNIGKAAKGQANDYELGRLNDVAMKLGALGLASYLFIKNPLKLSKAMEFVGLGTFFGGMALWPKLTIQAPLRARTGVDIHQKYIDSQGRKKMLHQDPQYDLTDLYSRKDLDMMGQKLKVDENLPDRDNFIKQRAKKTAIQGNTLWMMSAFSTPLISAVACNALEKPVGNLIEKAEMIASSAKLEKGSGFIESLKNSRAEKAIEKFLVKNLGKPMDDKLASELATKLGASLNSAEVTSAIKEELLSMKNSTALNKDVVLNAIKGIAPDKAAEIIANPEIAQAIESGSSVGKIASLLSQKMKGIVGKKVPKELIETSIKREMPSSVLTETVAQRVRDLNSSLASFSADRSILDRFLNARVVEQDGTYIAKQWDRVCGKLLKSLNLSSEELKALAQGSDLKDDVILKIDDLLDVKFKELVKDNARYEKIVDDLTNLINQYERQLCKVGNEEETFISVVKNKAQAMCEKAKGSLDEKGFKKIAEKIKSASGKGSVENTIITNSQERVLGAQSSFYRLLQMLDLYKQADSKGGNLRNNLRSALEAQGTTCDRDMIEKLVCACKKVINVAKTTDQIEKLGANGFGLSEKEFKAVMQVLYAPTEQTSSIKSVLVEQFGEEKARSILRGYEAYKSQFKTKVANWQNPMTPELQRRYVDAVTNSANGVERSNLVGSTVSDTIRSCANKTFNTNKWLKLFGISLAVVTAATLIIGLTFGRKSKMEKDAEKESKLNG